MEKKPNKAKKLVMTPEFKSQVEKPKKGKGSYCRKNQKRSDNDT